MVSIAGLGETRSSWRRRGAVRGRSIRSDHRRARHGRPGSGRYPLRDEAVSGSGPYRAVQVPAPAPRGRSRRTEEHTSELQSLMRISYAVFCLKKKKTTTQTTTKQHIKQASQQTKT